MTPPDGVKSPTDSTDKVDHRDPHFRGNTALVSSPEITIVIAVYNGAKFLPATLDSALAQTHTSFEVICVDDASTDESRSILERYAKKDARVRVFGTEANLGNVPKVINWVMPQIRGAFMAYASQDDLFSPDWLEKMHARAVETDADAVLPDVVFLRQPKETSTCVSGLRGRHDIVIDGREAVRLSMDWTITGFALWKMSLVRRIGFFSFAMNADEYSARVFFLNCKRVAFCDGTFYYSQNNPDSITKKASKGLFEIPGTHLRLYNFVVEHRFDDALCNEQFERAVSSLWWMKHRLLSPEIDDKLRSIADAKLREAHAELGNSRYQKPRRAARSPSSKFKMLGVESPYWLFERLVRAVARGRTLVGKLHTFVS